MVEMVRADEMTHFMPIKQICTELGGVLMKKLFYY